MWRSQRQKRSSISWKRLNLIYSLSHQKFKRGKHRTCDFFACHLDHSRYHINVLPSPGREEERCNLYSELEKQPKATSRKSYIHGIKEITKNSRKLDSDIQRISGETRDLQLESNSIRERLHRSYAVVDEMVTRYEHFIWWHVCILWSKSSDKHPKKVYHVYPGYTVVMRIVLLFFPAGNWKRIQPYDRCTS